MINVRTVSKNIPCLPLLAGLILLAITMFSRVILFASPAMELVGLALWTGLLAKARSFDLTVALMTTFFGSPSIAKVMS